MLNYIIALQNACKCKLYMGSIHTLTAAVMSALLPGLPTVDHVELKDVDTPTHHWKFVTGSGGKHAARAERE